MNSRRTPGTAAIAAWGALAVLGYLLAFGPACWLDAQAESPIVSQAVSIAYRPLIRIAVRFSPVETAVLWYAELGARRGTALWIGDDRIIWLLDAAFPRSVAPYYATISCTFGDDVDEAGTEPEPDPQSSATPADDAAP